MEETRLTKFSKGGGCGCKIAPSVLQEILSTTGKEEYQNLLVGIESSDDAAVYQLDENRAMISTTDFFLPIVDNAFDFGRIAAANAISDVYAMGGTPLMAIAILGWPVEKIPTAVAQQVLEGGRSICKEAGIPLAGGHTIDSSDPIFGLSVSGTIEIQHLKKNNGARAGDHLFLTKPIGVGILATAIKREMLSPEHYPAFLKQLTQLNKIGESLGKIKGVHAMTDVTGFGLLGHLNEMISGSNYSAEISYGAIEKIEGLQEYLTKKTIPDATSRNWNSYSKNVQFEKGVNVMEAFNVLPDPQTNGGLLVSVGEEALQQVKNVFEAFSIPMKSIGRVVEKKEKVIYVNI